MEYVAQLTDTGTGRTWRCSHDHITERDASRCADDMEERIGRLGWEGATRAWPQPSAANLEKAVALRTGQAPDRRRAWQASEAERWAWQQARESARRERRAAAKTARGPWRWPEWALIGAVIAFLVSFTLAGIGGSCTGSAAASAAGGLGLVSILGVAVAGPVTLWRRYRARQAAAAMLAAAARDQGCHEPPPAPSGGQGFPV